MRAGAGYVTLAVPRSIFGIVASTILESTYLPLPETDGDLGPLAAETLGKEIGRYQAMVLGCGLGREPGTAAFLQRLLGAAPRRRSPIGFGPEAAAAAAEPASLLPAELKLVIDADALNLLSDIENWHERISQPAVLTPNLREMARLTGQEVEAIETDPWEVALQAAARWRQVVVLKKGHTAVATPEGQLWIAEQASPALATAGSGDVLSGVIGALLAQGLAPAEAAVVAVHAGTLAAELGAARFGVGGLLAGDLPLLVAETLRDLSRG
jgi:NAD(P)H-hydrate epimerase